MSAQRRVARSQATYDDRGGRSAGTAALLGGLLAEPLADDGRDAVTAHGDAVERVANLHGALLVGDHEQLGAFAQLLVDLQEPAEVGVVERRLDLVEDVERRRSR